jgi:hypothetical protein
MNNIYIYIYIYKNLDFLQFQFNTFNNLTKVLLSENNIIQMTATPL